MAASTCIACGLACGPGFWGLLIALLAAGLDLPQTCVVFLKAVATWIVARSPSRLKHQKTYRQPRPSGAIDVTQNALGND
eukprot:scaffold143435_cov43-Prasinocladus_malaysianus.AAC.2